MTLHPWEDGEPGERLGIAHTVKHWLDPREMWEDLADTVENAVRPRSVLRALGLSAPWEQAYAPSAQLSARWTELKDPYRKGYLQVVLERVGQASPEGWTRIDRDRRAAVLPGGIYIEVRPDRGRDGWSLYTAYRPADFKLVDPECPPRDALSVQLRRQIAETLARRKLARKSEDGGR